MASATKKRSEKAAQSAAARWRQGTDHYLEQFKPVADRIHAKAKEMPHDGPGDAEKIVEMTIRELQEFADEYHSKEE